MKSENEFYISTDKEKLNLEMIHDYLCNHAYWCKGIDYKTVKTSIENSLNFGVYKGDEQLGFARVITDYATVAYLGDVFILPAYRGKGLSKMLMKELMEYPSLQGLRRWILLTGDAHELYKKFQWTDLKSPERWMEKHDPDIYRN
ncbi:GNAT family N-acetyltransferase [Leptobacterium flavescens]|uniref:GNAT family N-acetyltransferase n=1 Tax=Leptobacterium flavescens TaxID=472055 RepID=A0A6P0ULP0_9FLAO|nr:GNAT family N-acetyltransferase [Leptobacterium flavescens]NER14144.1 GNAT family N-acetyltransferase [Leptobacterium flavescens]